MLFNSLVFLAFFAVVYPAFLLLRRRYRSRNLLLLGASWLFYGWWDWRFLALLIGTSVVDWVIGLSLAGDNQTRRRRMMWLSVVMNLTVLGFFKYFNFFADSATTLLNGLGLHADPFTLKVVLPVGISFYTFQSMSYTLDVYWRRLKPERSFTDFALYVAFFPQLVAGPIERAGHLLDQFKLPRHVSGADLAAASWLFLWGLFKKLVVADNLAPIVNRAYADPSACGAGDVVVATLAFAFQIYCDFSGYSDMARGLARSMGFDLCLNFRLPYLASSPSDFWQRWHISLSTWLRDYLYIPLGGNRGGRTRTSINLMATMVLGGLWHGASWTFVLWGTFHGALLVAYRIGAEFIHLPGGAAARRAWLALGIAVMFVFTLCGWLLFRAQTMDTLHGLLAALSRPGGWGDLRQVAAYIAPVVAMHVLQAWSGNLLAPLRWPWPARGLLLAALIIGICLYGVRDANDFIYFQF